MTGCSTWNIVTHRCGYLVGKYFGGISRNMLTILKMICSMGVDKTFKSCYIFRCVPDVPSVPTPLSVSRSDYPSCPQRGASFFLPVDFKQCDVRHEEHGLTARYRRLNRPTTHEGIENPCRGNAPGHPRRKDRQGPGHENLRHHLHIFHSLLYVGMPPVRLGAHS